MLDIIEKTSYNRYIDNTDNSYRNKGDVNPFSFVVDENNIYPKRISPLRRNETKRNFLAGFLQSSFLYLLLVI